MIPIVSVAKNMRVLTPRNLIARVLGVALRTSETDGEPRVNLQYLDANEGEVSLPAKLLRCYRGAPVLWPDEKAALQRAAGE